MWKLLGSFLLSISPALAAKVMASLGITLFTYAGVTTFLNGFVDSANNSFDNLSLTNSVVFSLLSIAGFSQAVGIMSGALSARIGLLILKKWGLT